LEFVHRVIFDEAQISEAGCSRFQARNATTLDTAIVSHWTW